ncbi:hypothetical protein [Rathayibacter oskolensis]|nr:hypothetical protein [Rathayibacter oskolensis]
MMNPKTSDRDKIAAAKDLLDRNGFIGKQELSVDMKISKFDEVARDIIMDIEPLESAFTYHDIVDADEVDDEPERPVAIEPAPRNVPAPRTATDEEWAEEQAYHRRNRTPARTDASDPAPPRRKAPARRPSNVPKMQTSTDAPRQPGPVQSRRDTVVPPEHPPVEADPRARETDGPRKRPRVAGRQPKR